MMRVGAVRMTMDLRLVLMGVRMRSGRLGDVVVVVMAVVVRVLVAQYLVSMFVSMLLSEVQDEPSDEQHRGDRRSDAARSIAEPGRHECANEGGHGEDGARSTSSGGRGQKSAPAAWQIGREIVEHLQGGEDRAGYGEALIEALSEQLRGRFGRGYSTTNLRYFRTFFLAYPTRKPEIRHIRGGELPAASLPAGRAGQAEIRHVQGGVLEDLERATLKDSLDGFSPRLGWAHYRALMKVEHSAARRFYEIEAESEGWSVEHLERQIHTQLFARLLKSRDKAGVMDLASRGQVLERPIDAIKHP